MAFDIQALLARIMGQGAQPQPNMLTAQPNAQPETNRLAAVPPQVDPMQTGSVTAPAPQQQAPGFMQRMANFSESDAGGRLNDMFTGWAMGATPQESIGRGAFMVAQGNQTRKGKAAQNQTVEWLKGKGMDEGQAKLIASNPPALSEYLKSQMGGQKPIEINGQLVDPDTYEVIGDFRTPAAGDKPTSAIQEYEYARQQGYTGTFADYEKEQKRAGASSVNVGFNATESASAGFADRASQAENILADPKLGPASVSGSEKLKGSIPLIGNYITSDEYKMVDQAKRNFINSILRKESGAVISPTEFENAEKQYFPQPGDTPDVIKQKAENRRVSIEGLQRSAGPSYVPPTAVAPPPADGGDVQEGATATNPTTGQKIIFKGGQWVSQ